MSPMLLLYQGNRGHPKAANRAWLRRRGPSGGCAPGQAPSVPSHDGLRAYPKVRLDLDFDDRIKDIVAEGVDLAIRSGDLPDSALMSRKLGVVRYFLCAAPSYIAEHGEPARIAALSDHRVIRFRHPGTDVLQDWRLASGSVAELERATQAIICTN